MKYGRITYIKESDFMEKINIEEKIKLIKKGVAEIVPEDALVLKLKESEKTGKPLVIKLGLDPSAPDIHIGHAVVLRKLKTFQDLGHTIVIIIGDYTGMIGDPTGKSETRKQLTKEQVLENAETYKKQIFKILDKDKTAVKFNSEWLSKLNFADVLELAGKYTVAQMLEREDFKNRYLSSTPIHIHEFFYPLMQGYDSVNLEADIELGGTDQRFNVLMGRTLQKEYGVKKIPQVGIFMPILEGTDGVNKMSKSLKNYIGINESPNEIYGKTMSIPDNMIIKYYELATDIHPDKIEEMKKSLKNDLVNPMQLKKALARELVTIYHNEDLAIKAEENFINVFKKKDIPDDIEVVQISKEELGMDNKLDLLIKLGYKGSKSELRRLIDQGGFKINGEKKSLEEICILNDDIIQFGKRSFIKIKEV